MRALLLGFALLAFASAGPVGAWQPSEDYPAEETEPTEPGVGPRSDPRGDGPRTAPPRSDRPTPGGRCRSDADEKETAEEFCEGQLDCSSAGKKVDCQGQSRRWICKCV